MKTVLEKLYDGEIYPFEQICPKSKEYRELLQRISDEMGLFKEKFAEDDSEKFDELCVLMNRQSIMEGEENFLFGFKLGASVVIEVLAN